MKSNDPLLAAWDGTLRTWTDASAICDSQRRVSRTFNDIEQRARNFESKLDPLRAGEVLAVQIGNHPDWPSILLACLRRKIVALPLEQSIGKQERDSALQICCAKGIVTAVVAGGSDFEILPLNTGAATTRWEQDPPSFLKLTSGTTATPRAIRFQGAQLLADCDQICATMGITDVDLNFGVIPVSHSYGFSNLLTPLLAHGVRLVLSQDRVPRAVFEDLARTEATVFPGMPVFYQAFCEMTDLPELPHLRLCISAGAPLAAAIASKFRGKFQQPIHSFYGASECGGICYDREGTAFEDGFVGAPMQNVDLELIETGAKSSRVRVCSAAVGDGYFPEPDEQKLSNGIFIPDDLLARSDAGFKIVGRTSDVINVAGKKVNPAEVEAHLLQFAGVREAIVFGRTSSLRNEEVVACVVMAANVDESQLMEFCRGQLSAWQVPKRIFIVDKIPVNERGKTSRRDLGVRFARL